MEKWRRREIQAGLPDDGGGGTGNGADHKAALLLQVRRNGEPWTVCEQGKDKIELCFEEVPCGATEGGKGDQGRS